MDTILIVDDERQLLAPLRLALEEAGFAVETTATGPEGLEQAATTRPALVVLDAGRPGLDGFEAVRRLRRVSDVPLILLTAGADQAERARGLELGADDCLTTPVNPRELAARVKAILRRVEGDGMPG